VVTVDDPVAMPVGPLRLKSAVYQRPLAHLKHLASAGQGHHRSDWPCSRLPLIGVVNHEVGSYVYATSGALSDPRRVPVEKIQRSVLTAVSSDRHRSAGP
jgi:hypothetical protein